MSKITVTTIAGQTSGSDANKVKIESGDTLEVTTNATVGGTLGVTGAITGTSQTLNKASSGTVLDLKLSNTSVGGLGVISDRVYLEAEGSHSVYLDASANDFNPGSATGTDNDGNINLGASFARWKDLYLSGGAYIGGTGAANQLDDYEEGTFTARLATDASGSAPNYDNTGYYVKVGKIVHIHAQTTISGSSSGGSNLHIVLPFTATDTRGALAVGLNQPLGMKTNGEYLSIVVELNQAKGYIVSHAFGGGHSHLDYNNVGTGIFSFSGSYRVA